MTEPKRFQEEAELWLTEIFGATSPGTDKSLSWLIERIVDREVAANLVRNAMRGGEAFCGKQLMSAIPRQRYSRHDPALPAGFCVAEEGHEGPCR